MLKWTSWILQALVAANALMHAGVMARPMGPMADQFGVFPTPVRLLIALIYAVCAVGLVVPDFIRKAQLVTTAALALAVTAAVEAGMFFVLERPMAGGSRASIVVILLILVLVRRKMQTRSVT
ncbi:MAG: hypothetical protein JNK21_11025 [Rhodospirillaceae bacterium]|nr:hypothetical protein [Rhodospirillaceae bacterium]